MFLSVSKLTRSYDTGTVTHVLKGVDLAATPSRC